MDFSQISSRVARRYAFLVESDDRYRPPKWLAYGVETGEIPTQGLLVWKYVVEKMGPKFSYGGATVYWRNKCKKEGVDLLPKFQQAGEGAEFGPFKIKTGDQIEDWVKERLRSEHLINDAVKTASEWELEIAHLERMIQEAQERIAKHRAGIEQGSRVQQREKWLAEAESDLDKATKDMDAARAAVGELKETAVRHVDHQAPCVDFENQFQSLLQAATIDLSKREVLAQAKAAIAKFEDQMAATPRMATTEKMAILDKMWGMIQRAWNWVVSAFEDLRDWVRDLVGDTKRLSKLLDAAGA